jgi:plastocyanin
MQKIIATIIIVLAVCVAIGGGAYLVTRKASGPVATPVPSMNMASPSGQTSSNNPAAVSSVSIKDYAFTPASITVKKGTTVTWTNADSVGHTVTETDGQAGPSSGTLDQGKSYSFTFNTAGTFHYECKIHPYMTGTVTVTD